MAGLALLLVFGRRGWVGAPLDALGLRLTFTQLAVVMAQTFIAVPLFVRAAVIGFAAVEPELEDAAAIDGANGWQVFRHISLPLAIYLGFEMELGVAVGLSVILVGCSFVVLLMIKLVSWRGDAAN